VTARAPGRFRIAVDLTILTIQHGRLMVLLIERGQEPFRGKLALPGGFVRAGEDLPEAAVRELDEETGIDGSGLHLEQVRTYAGPGRDPRGSIASVSYLAIAPDLPAPAAGSDAATAGWEAAEPSRLKRRQLAFDHDQIMRDALERARAKLEYTPLATAFCQPPFTIGELRAVYEAVWGVPLDPRNFHRKVTGVPGFVEPIGKERRLPTGRPATLYRPGGARQLHPPMLRPRRPA
jgi:8-oxo-dGTP diphosphatase